MRPRRAPAFLALAIAGGATAASADCQLELELLGRDLRKVRITQAQGQQLAPFVDDALRYCRTGHERLAEQSIGKARAIAHIPRRDPLDDADPPAPDADSDPAR